MTLPECKGIHNFLIKNSFLEIRLENSKSLCKIPNSNTLPSRMFSTNENHVKKLN